MTQNQNEAFKIAATHNKEILLGKSDKHRKQ